MTSSDSDTIELEKIRAAYLNSGFSPLTWNEVLTEVRQRFQGEKLQQFQRYHQSFITYPTEATSKRFYGFAYREGMGSLLARYRFHRLTRCIAWLNPLVPEGIRILDVGAGTGHVLQWLSRHKQPSRLGALDWAPESKTLWPIGCSDPIEGETFNIVLCLDVLGECHGDEDEMLKSMPEAQLESMADLIEERYGFASKLEHLRGYMGTHSYLYLTEPIPYALFWHALSLNLHKAGWSVEVVSLPKGPLDPEGYGLKIAPDP